jgi:hypothetical protein
MAMSIVERYLEWPASPTPKRTALTPKRSRNQPRPYQGCCGNINLSARPNWVTGVLWPKEAMRKLNIRDKGSFQRHYRFS